MTTTDTRVGTYADITAEYGDPQDGGRPGAAAAARHVAALHQERLDAIIADVERRGGNLLADEQRAFDAHRGQAQMLERAAELYDVRAQNEGMARVSTGSVGPASEARTTGSAFHTGGGRTYRQDDPHGPSFLKDLAHFGLRGDPEAAQRLHRNNKEVAVETRALTTTDGAGGDFAPPAWLVEQYVELARTARPTADRVTNLVLPTGTDQLNVPKILTGTATAEQATQNTAVQNTDATTGQIAANVATIAGQQVVSLQLIEQSPISVDTMLLQDLTSDLAAKVDLFVLNNNAANKKGLLQEAGTTTVTFTSGAPTVALFYPKLADAIQQVTTQRFLSPDTIVMHPRRWAWLLAATDTSGRPLVVPLASQGANNALGVANGAPAANGVVGSLAGLDVILDPQVPTNLGAGTNQDPVIVFRASDSVLWESPLHVEAFREPLAAQLSMLLRVYEYAAFTTARYAKSVAIVNGTGMTPPAF